MKTISVAIKTKDRSPRKNYLQETLQNFARSGGIKSPALKSLVICDSTGGKWLDGTSFELADTSHGKFGMDIPEEPRSLHKNAARAIQIASAVDSDYVLVLEDDLDFCADFLGSVLRWVREVDASGKFLMYVLGANYSQILACVKREELIWNYPVAAFYGAQALLWRTSVARQLGEWLGDDPTYNGVRAHGHDLLLQKWGLSLDVKFFAASAPSFVQHIGQESGINNRYFKFESWPGREWRFR